MVLEIKKSVREFVEVVLKSGSLDNRFKTNARALEGVKAHQKLQKSNNEIYKNYEKEVYLKTYINMESFILHLEGRCDGIISDGNSIIVEEIKSTYVPLIEIFEDFNVMHWSQGKIYAYMICKEKNIKTIYVQLSYYNLESNEVKSFLKKYEFKDLDIYVEELANYYKKYVLIEIKHRELRNETIKKMKFPFEKYRDGQLKLIKACYGTIKEGRKIFLQAPTGIGKTISTVFPSIKALGEGLADRIFYLTAKGVNRKVAEESFEILRNQGLIFRSIVITAKEKICLNDKVNCNEEECTYAKGYYDKVKNIIFEIIEKENNISVDKIIYYAKKYKVCSFELSLDLVKWCDGVICDYNYIFDPKVYLRRIVDEDGEKNIILIDEAHNLVDRSRSIYSAKLNKSKLLDFRREVRGILPNLYKSINKINKLFIEERRNCESQEKNTMVYKAIPKELCKELRGFNKEAEEILTRKDKLNFHELLLEIYFDISSFLAISEMYGDDYVTYVDTNKDEVLISLFCVDPSIKLKDTMNKFRAVILFSATLSPFQYFIKVLGGDVNDYRLKLKSPFPKENLKVCLYKGNTRYSARDKTLSKICFKILDFIENIKGNYIIFFPSYEYLNKARIYFRDNFEEKKIIFQDSNMDEGARDKFLAEFKEERNTIGLCVMGGMFSEGIDLPGNKLIGVVVIGVGYPKISLEGDIIKSHFGEEGERIAYVYPGINKVMQAVGRVIRTEYDKGRVLLIDDRYIKGEYFNLLPNEWKPLNIIN
ncbi:ATP-dependent DNA helicase [Clostridium sp. SHJSY1]|uniref:ATP-dependent DNA helicase n=1 Tax=Clostridium sp. SHJSY1 TaxID=2942483 RepID=UPI002876244F|nr:ATP-dependent DNA helicase [Clostridium sp. SHJSY1]MDS0526207.1 ATP-dependent DNA helicase [Clostridium sp. SHJSY1]